MTAPQTIVGFTGHPGRQFQKGGKLNTAAGIEGVASGRSTCRYPRSSLAMGSQFRKTAASSKARCACLGTSVPQLRHGQASLAAGEGLLRPWGGNVVVHAQPPSGSTCARQPGPIGDVAVCMFNLAAACMIAKDRIQPMAGVDGRASGNRPVVTVEDLWWTGEGAFALADSVIRGAGPPRAMTPNPAAHTKRSAVTRLHAPLVACLPSTRHRPRPRPDHRNQCSGKLMCRTAIGTAAVGVCVT